MDAMTREIPLALRDLAEQQCGVICRRQALEAGVSADTVKSRLRRGTRPRVRPPPSMIAVDWGWRIQSVVATVLDRGRSLW